MGYNKEIHKSYYGYVFSEVFQSEKYTGASKINKIKAIAQLVFAKDRTQNKEDCVWQALEWYEDMSGVFFDPTHEQFEEICCSII